MRRTDDIVLTRILTVIRDNVLVVLPDLDPDLVRPPRSLNDLGCTRGDRADVVSMTVEQLGITAPAKELSAVRDIGGLADLLRRHVPG